MKPSRGRLIVLSGAAGAGKDSVVKLLVNEHGWVCHSLAAPLKRFVEDLMGFSHDQLYGPSASRNAPDPRWARPCPVCIDPITGEATGRGCATCDETMIINDNSPRRVLQLLGEEYLRQMIHPDALTLRARGEIDCLLSIGRDVVVNDGRNPNDRNNLHAWFGGRRVDVRSTRTRSPKKRNDVWRLHLSEQRHAADDQIEYVLQNDEPWPFPALPGKVETMLRELFQ